MNTASYPDVSLDVRAKEGGNCLVPRRLSRCARKGRREGDNGRDFACRLYPSHGPLRFITSHSFRARLCHAKNEAPEEEAGMNTYPNMWLSLQFRDRRCPASLSYRIAP